MPKKTKEKPKPRTKIEKEVLQALTQTLNAGDLKDEVFHRLKKKVLTKERINSICDVLDNIKETNPQTYLYYIGYFISIYDRHRALEQKLEIEQQRLDLQKLQVAKSMQADNDIEEETPDNLIETMLS